MLFPISPEPSVPYQFLIGLGGVKPLPGLRSKRRDSCIGFPSLDFPYGERDYLGPSFDMDCLLALWPLLLLVSLVNWTFSHCVVIFSNPPYAFCLKAPFFQN